MLFRSGTQSRSVSAGVEIRSDGSGRLIVTSREGGYAGDNVEAESYYAVQFYVTEEVLIEAAKDGKLDSVDVTNMLGDGGTQFSGIGIGTIGISYGEMNRYDKCIHVSREGDISARGYTSKFNPDSDESRVTTESVSVLATKVDLANAVNNAKNSFDRQAAK